MKIKIKLTSICMGIFIILALPIFSLTEEIQFIFFSDETNDNIIIPSNTDFIKAKAYTDANIDIYLDGNECEKGKYDEFFCASFTNGAVYIDAKPSETGVIEFTTFSELDSADLTVFGTQYFQGEQIRSFVQLLDDSVPIENASCYIDIINPDNTFFKENQLMLRFNDSLGLYYFDTIATNIGIHMLNVECFYNVFETLNFPVDYEVITGVDKGHPLSRMQADDGSYFETEDTAQVIDVYYNFSNIILQENNVSSITVILNGILEVGGGNLGSAELSIWNFTSSSWVSLPNQWIGNDNQEDTVTNTIDIDAFNNSFLQDGYTNIRINDTADPGEDLKKFKVDLLEIEVDQLLGQTINDIRGGGEIHVQIPIVNFTATLNSSLDSAIFAAVSNINNNTNTSISISQDIILDQINNNVTSILDQIINSENNIIITINGTQIAINDSIQQALADMLNNLTEVHTDISNQFTNLNNQLVILLDSQTAILNGSIENNIIAINDSLNNAVTSIINNDNSNANAIMISINNSETLILAKINETDSLLFDITNNQTIALNDSIQNAHTETQNLIINKILGLNESLQIVESNIETKLSEINVSIISHIGNDTAFLSGIIGNDTQNIIDNINSDTLSIISNDNSNKQMIIDALNSSNFDFFIEFIGNDTPELLSAIGNDTQYIIDTLNADFGNDTQIIIDSILFNTTLDIDDLGDRTKQKLESMNDSLRLFITSEINDVQGDISTQTTTITGAISSQTTTLTTSIVNTGNNILEDLRGANQTILNAIGNINLTIDTFGISEAVWTFDNRTLTDFLFNVSLANLTVELNDNVTNQITGNVPAEFDIGVCSTSQGSAIILGSLMITALILIFIGLGIPAFGIFGSIMMLVLSWFIAGCIGVAGWIFAGIGLIGIIFFALRKT